jgi:two-component system nitrate/nitrite response regulator NarL
MHIVIADDHPLYREAVCLRLERVYPQATVGGVASIDELLALNGVSRPAVDLILVDLRMPGMSGGASIGRIVLAFANAAVVLMSGEATLADVTAAVQVGAKGYLPKTISSELFSSAVAIVLEGGTYLPSEVLNAEGAAIKSVSSAAPTKLSIDLLTPRQQAVLVRLTAGASNKEIGRDLGLSEVTVKLHVRQILKKIGARNRAEATAVAIKSGLI